MPVPAATDDAEQHLRAAPVCTTTPLYTKASSAPQRLCTLNFACTPHCLCAQKLLLQHHLCAPPRGGGVRRAPQRTLQASG
eukprot:6782879-Pyramimonas_sp.AAC.1